MYLDTARAGTPWITAAQNTGVNSPEFSGSPRPNPLHVSVSGSEQGAQVVTPVLSHFPTGEVRHSEIRAKQEEKSAVQEEIQLSLTLLEKKSS